LKVEAVEAFPLRVKAEDDLQSGTFRYPDHRTVLVRAVCDGTEGWGEAMTRSDPAAMALTVRYIAKEIAGHTFPDVRSATRGAWRELRVRGHTRGMEVEALSGVEIALCDCYSRILGRPAGEVFGGGRESEAAVFAGSLFESRGPLEDQVEAAKAAEMLGAKVKIGFGVERDSETMARARRAWPEGMLVADANGAYDGETALRACRALEGLRLSWFEEPVLSDDWEGYAMLKGAGVSIGAGESWFGPDFERPLREGLVDVLEPSVSRCGGLEVEISLAEKARKAGLGFSPMTGMNSGVSLAASLQAASVYPSLGVEFNPFPNPLQTELVTGLPEPRGGKITVPRSPGLGVEVDRRFLDAHLVR
jgi:D-galactarolactone cycloisomerase